MPRVVGFDSPLEIAPLAAAIPLLPQRFGILLRSRISRVFHAAAFADMRLTHVATRATLRLIARE
jgi:hypothetical protein